MCRWHLHELNWPPRAALGYVPVESIGSGATGLVALWRGLADGVKE